MSTIRIRGDWMHNGYIDNLNRQRRLEILVVAGKAYDPEMYGWPDDGGRMTLTADEEIQAWGNGVGFSPAPGELDRIGRQIFAT